MQFILDFIDFLINTISSVWSFFTGLIEDLILFVQYLGMAFTLAASCLFQLPTWLKIFATVTVGVSVMYLIVGRNAGRSS